MLRARAWRDRPVDWIRGRVRSGHYGAARPTGDDKLALVGGDRGRTRVLPRLRRDPGHADHEAPAPFLHRDPGGLTHRQRSDAVDPSPRAVLRLPQPDRLQRYPED